VIDHKTAIKQKGLKGLNESQRNNIDIKQDKKNKKPKAVNLVVTG
jgi:cold shock CspA family protein